MQNENVTPQDYMENWLLQINFPQIKVDVSTAFGKTTVSFKQSRFNFNQKYPDSNIGIISPFK